MRGNIVGFGMALGIVTIIGSFFQAVQAYRFSSSDYVIDASVTNTFGGQQSSASYKLTSSGGENIVGDGAGGSYKMGIGFVPQTTSSLRLTVQPTGLVAHFPFDEGSGAAIWDATANDNVGYVKSPADWTTQTAEWTTGKVGEAVKLTSRQIWFDSNPVQRIAQPYTVSIWMKSGDITNYPDTFMNLIVCQSEAGRNYGIYLMKGANYATMTASFDGALFDKSGTKNVTDGAWHHIVYTYTGTEMRLYVDGVLDTSAVKSGALSTDSTQRLFMQPPGVGGQLDEAKLFNRSLSAAEILAEYQAQAAGKGSGLAFPGQLQAGVPQTIGAVATVTTKNPYSLAINQSGNMSDGAGHSIPAIAGSISNPIPWSQGGTKGLGFTVQNASGAVSAAWNNGNAYAAIPNSATAFYTRSDTPSAQETLLTQFKVDIGGGQPLGNYSNTVTITGTGAP